MHAQRGPASVADYLAAYGDDLPAKVAVFAVTFKQTAAVCVRYLQPAGCEMCSETSVDNVLEDPESVYIVH